MEYFLINGNILIKIILSAITCAAILPLINFPTIRIFHISIADLLLFNIPTKEMRTKIRCDYYFLCNTDFKSFILISQITTCCSTAFITKSVKRVLFLGFFNGTNQGKPLK